MHIKNRGDPEPDGLFNRVDIATKSMNMRVDESGYNCAARFAVCGSVYRDGCFSLSQLLYLSVRYNDESIFGELLAIEYQDILYYKSI